MDIELTIHRLISFGLSLALVFTSCFMNATYADNKTILSPKIYYHLDMGVQLAYNESCSWGSQIFGRDSITASPAISMDSNVEVVDVYPYEGSGYDIDGGTDNLAGTGSGQENYDTYYEKYVSTSMSVKSFGSNGSSISFSYLTKLDTPIPLDVVSLGYARQDSIVYQLFGSKSQLENQYPEIAAAIETALTAGREGTANGNKLYLIFCPTVIEYKKYVTIGDLEAALDLPESAKQGEEYTVSDASMIDDSITVDYALLEKRYDSGAWETVTTWNGTGKPGANTGRSIDESCEDICTVTYRLTVYDIYGQSDTATASIEITDKRDISVTADLVLPPYTFEGHKTPATDRSIFEVDGVNYSAERAYAEKIARNSFKENTSYGTVSRLTSTQANVTFSKRGTYSVTLTVTPVSGGKATDTEPIEVKKTPFIIDSLSGFQKQNRKQILNIAVATFPGKPITEYAITLKDKKTGGSVTLTEDNPQENNATIKTRAVSKTESDDGCFTYFTVEFLTKTPAYNPSHPDSTQDFYYEIRMKDSKGDTDTASKTFTVKPDLPPTPAISLESAFLRNEGTNIAAIKAEDATVAADGDSVERKWYYGATTAPAAYTDVSTMDGYKKLSFGTDKTVGFNKAGVGKFTTKLFVKEVWTEPTLEEYVSDSEHLTGTAIAYSDVQNVAPIVSLELLNGIEQEILLLANNDLEYQTLMNNKTALQQALLADKIDGRIIIKKLIGNTPANVTGIQQQLSYQFPAPVWKSGMADEISYSKLTTDSEKTYLATWTWINNNPTVPITVHAYSPYSGEVWAYTTSRNEVFSFGSDDTGRYLYLIYPESNQTVVLDKRTGAVAGTINMALSDKVWLSDNLAFMVQNGSLYTVDLNSLSKILLSENVSAVSRANGKLQYITKSDTGILRNTLDMETLERKSDLLINTFATNDYTPVCIDSTGNAVFCKAAGVGTDTFSGIRVYSANNSLSKEIAYGFGTVPDCFPTVNEKGVCEHVLVWHKNTSNGLYYLTGFNLNTGSVSDWTASGKYSFCTMFESQGTSYFFCPGWYYNSGYGYCGNAVAITFNGSALSAASTGAGMIGSYDENLSSSDRMVASLFGDNANGTLKMKISTFPKTLVQETAEVISKFADKFTFVGNANTTAAQIKSAAEAAKPVVKVSAANNGYLYLNNLSLTPGKKYYYEYEVKPLTTGTKDQLNGITASTGTSSSTQTFSADTLYVADSYEEDFNDGSINKFFTVDSAGCYRNGKYGAYNDSAGSGYSKLSFTVPSGKCAILSFDYSLYLWYDQWSGTNIFIDGLRMDENPYASGDNGTSWVNRTGSKVFYKVLEPGTHTIECKVSATSSWWEWVLMDNLKVDLLSTSPKSTNTAFHINASDEKTWYTVNGTFNVPNKTISYGSQACSTYYGGLPAAVTSTTYYKSNYYPKIIEYYQTVPAGYFQKGYVHLISNTEISAGGRITFVINGVGTITKSSPPYRINEWVYMGAPKSEGTFTHSASPYKAQYYQGYLDIFDIVSYPNNTVTATGNFAFNAAKTEIFFPKESSTKVTNLSMYLPKGDYYLKNLKVYYIEDGHKVYLQNKALDDISQLPDWVLSSGLTASNVTDLKAEKDDDEYIKIYKKGERVLYNIFYDDYEKDPSKAGYWVYQHINWPPDPVHPDAGKVLTQPIDRFYLSGKYTVTHWQLDNTQRPGTAGDASPYDRESNKVDLVFYVDGGGEAPWVTYIKTNPQTVRENNVYTLAVGVDDAEKDTLKLETEVYLNGKRILDHLRENLQADSSGNYPETLIGGLPAAKPGVYQVICTVSDYGGTGVKAYKFTVVSEGKVTGFVNHTDQWDTNRKKYNLKRFSEEVNRTLPLNDYVAMSAPRMRGTNVFWSGEKFMLRAETEGDPERVTVEILSRDAQGGLKSAGYSAELANTGRKTSTGAGIWDGSLWNAAMINKWGRKAPEELVFRFTAHYPGDVVKAHSASVIMDSDRDYWQLHRLW